MLKNLGESLPFKGIRTKIAEATDGLGVQMEGRLKEAVDGALNQAKQAGDAMKSVQHRIGEGLAAAGGLILDDPKAPPEAAETPLQEFMRLFNEARGELDDHDMLDLPASNNPATVAEVTNRANKAVLDLHAFLAKHPVGSIKLP